MEIRRLVENLRFVGFLFFLFRKFCFSPYLLNFVRLERVGQKVVCAISN